MSTANFLIKQTVEKSQIRQDSLLALRLGVTALVSFLFVMKQFVSQINIVIAGLGILAGILQGGMMYCTTRSMSTGPASLVLSVQNACSVLPALLMAWIFGAQFGHTFNIWNLIGTGCVALGLFFAFSPSMLSLKSGQFIFSLGLLVVFQVLFFLFFQWIALMQQHSTKAHPLLFHHLSQEEARLFLPVCFFSAFVMNWVLQKKRHFFDPSLSAGQHILFGVMGGVAAAFGGKFLELSTWAAYTPIENALLFPLLAVSQVVLCSLWGRYFFAEKIVWTALAVSLLGLFIALYA